MHARVQVVALALIAQLVGACGLTDIAVKLGPPFAPAPARRGEALVYAYRVNRTSGALQTAHVVVGGRERLLYSGGYTAIYLPPGNYIAYAGTPGARTEGKDATNFAPGGDFPTIGAGNLYESKPVSFHANAGGTVYLRVESEWGGGGLDLTIPDKATGASELSRTSLSPGGRAR